jgi:hypothetical protein
MLTLEENLELNNDYNTQKDWILKSFCYLAIAFFFVDLIRSQIPEIKLLQLAPGVYLFLLFFSFLFLVTFSTFLNKLVFETEIVKNYGTKTFIRIKILLSREYSNFLFFLIMSLNFKTVIPVTLDSFNSYIEETLENFWSISEILSLESFLVIVLTILSQIPITIIIFFITEKDANFLPKFWRLISLIIVILSGFFTPTIDGYTQLSFSFSGFSLFLVLLSFLKKRVTIKFNGIVLLGF